MNQYSVFISHSSNDDDFVQQLAHDLRREGILTWVDDARIKPGDDFISKIEEGLTNASHVIIVLSPYSIISDWVREETHAAQIRAIKGSARLIPILIGGFNSDDVPLLLRSRLYVNFNAPADYDISLRPLLSAFSSENDSATPMIEIPSPRIEEINILSHREDSNLALEILLVNLAYRPISIHRFMAYSRVPYRVSYFIPPPTVTYHLDLQADELTQEGFSEISGQVRAESDPWGRSVIGNLVVAPYHTLIEVSFPLYLELARGDKGILRFVVNKFSFLDRGESVGKARIRGQRTLIDPELALTLKNIPSIPPDIEPDSYRNGESVVIFRTHKGKIIAAKTPNSFLFDLIQPVGALGLRLWRR